MINTICDIKSTAIELLQEPMPNMSEHEYTQSGLTSILPNQSPHLGTSPGLVDFALSPPKLDWCRGWIYIEYQTPHRRYSLPREASGPPHQPLAPFRVTAGPQRCGARQPGCGSLVMEVQGGYEVCVSQNGLSDRATTPTSSRRPPCCWSIVTMAGRAVGCCLTGGLTV